MTRPRRSAASYGKLECILQADRGTDLDTLVGKDTRPVKRESR